MTNQSERTLLEGTIRYLAVLRGQSRIIILVTAIPTLLAVAFAIATRFLPVDFNPYPNTYTAKATILTQQQPGGNLAISLLSALGIDQATINSSAGYDTGSLVLHVLHSRSLLDRVVDEFGLIKRYHGNDSVRGATRNMLLKKLSFEYIRAAGVISISFEDTDPQFARDVVNRMIALLDQWFSQNSGSAKKRQIQMLEEKVNEVKADITGLEDRLKSLQKQYGVLNAQELGASQAASLADLRSQLILKEIEIKNYTSFSVVDDPKLQQLREEHQNILDLIERIEKGMPEDLHAESSSASTQSLPDVAQKFSQLTLELEIQKRIYNTLSPQYQAAKLTADSESLFQVLEYAEAPDMKSGPQRSRLVLLVALGSLVSSLVISSLIRVIRTINADPEKKAMLRGGSSLKEL